MIGRRLAKDLIVKAVDRNNEPVADLPIFVSVLSEPDDMKKGMQIDPKQGSTGKDGLFRVSVELGDKAGVYKVMFLAETDKPSFAVYSVNANNPNWGYFLILGLLGGLAIFLYGMKIAAGGMQRTAGGRLKDVLSSLTKTPLIGVLMGIIITFFTQLYSMWKTFMKGTDIGKTSSRTNNSKRSSRFTFEKEEAGGLFGGVLPRLLFCIEVVENCFAVVDFVNHVVNCAHYDVRVHMVVIRQERTNIVQWRVIIICAIIPRQ